MLKSLKNFAIAFAIAAVIVGIAMIIIVNSVEDVLTGSFRKAGDDIAEILNEPDRSMEQLSEDLNARPEVVKDLINDIETALNQDKGGKENDE